MSPIADNNVEIVVTGTDRTDPLWRSVDDKARKAGKSSGEAMSQGAAGTVAAAVKAGGTLGDGLATGAEKRLRRAGGRFVRISSDVGKVSGEAMSQGAAGTVASAVKAGEELGEALVKGATKRMRDSRGRFVKAGEEVGKSSRKGMGLGFVTAGIKAAIDFVRGMGGKLGDLLDKLPISRNIAGAIAAGAPLVGGAVAGAVLAGLAGGTVAGGVAIAFKDPTVKAEASALGEFVGDKMKIAASSFVVPTRQALATIRGEWDDIDQDIAGAFRAAARYVVPLTQGVMDTIEEIGPGLQAAVEGAEPVINVIANELPQMGEAIGKMFQHLGENADDSAMALGTLLNIMSSSIELVDTAMTGLTKSFGSFVDLVEGVDEVAPDWTPIGAAAGWLREQFEELRDEAERAPGMFREVEDAGEGSQHAMDAMAERADILAGSMAEAVEQTGSLADALNILNGGFIDSREAERDYQEAIDDLNKSIKENGKTLDVNTKKGRENQENLDKLAESVSKQMDTVYAQTEATRGSAAAQDAANGVYERGRAQLIRSARQMGLSKAAAEKYADSIIGIPKDWNTDIRSNAPQARDQAREAARAVRSIPTRWMTTIEVRELHREAARAYATGGVVGSAATGGVRSNRVRVGEGGPEIVDLAPGSRVHSAPDSRRMMGEAAAAGTLTGGADGAAMGGGRLEVRARFDPQATDLLQRAIADSIRLEVWRAGGVEGMGGSRWSPRRA